MSARESSPQSKIDVTVQRILVPSVVFGETVKGGSKCLETGLKMVSLNYRQSGADF